MLDFTGGKGVDLAIDSYGATMLDRTFNVVRKLGHIISIGEAEGQPLKNIASASCRVRRPLRAFTWGTSTRARPNGRPESTMCWRDRRRWLKVPIEKVFPLEKAADMHRALEGRHVVGKLLLKAR